MRVLAHTKRSTTLEHSASAPCSAYAYPRDCIPHAALVRLGDRRQASNAPPPAPPAHSAGCARRPQAGSDTARAATCGTCARRSPRPCAASAPPARMHDSMPPTAPAAWRAPVHHHHHHHPEASGPSTHPVPGTRSRHRTRRKNDSGKHGAAAQLAARSWQSSR
jgi:hypothetical protein